MADFNLPNDHDRLAIFGRTGSGKTQAAVWHLAQRSYDRMPWIVFNFKGDELINAIPGTHDLGLEDSIPTRPGIYVVRDVMTRDKEDQELLDGFFHRAWAKQKVGLYVDEGYVATGLRWFRACLQQGRSRRVPMIVLSQQPVWIDTFVWSEADYFQAFQLNRKENVDKAESMIPGYRSARSKGLVTDYHSVWHDVKQDATFVLSPVPERDTIIGQFRARLPTRTKILA